MTPDPGDTFGMQRAASPFSRQIPIRISPGEAAAVTECPAWHPASFFADNILSQSLIFQLELRGDE